MNYRDDTSSVDRWGQGEVTLRAKGNSFEGDSESIGRRLYVAASGDFDKDGWVDMVALMLDPSCHLHFLRNKGMAGSPPVHQGFDLGPASFEIDSPPGCATESPVLVSGDFDGDGDTDVLYLRLRDENRAGQLHYAYLYEYTGISAGAPQFTRRNVFADLDGYGVAWHWTSTVAQVVDWDGDGRDDLVMASSHGSTNEILLFRAKTTGLGFQAPVTLIPDVGMYTPIASASRAASGGSACPPSTSRGINTVIVGDFDADNDNDIVVGSTSERDLKYWTNDGADVFTRNPDIPFPEGAAALGVAGDFDGDGDLDFVVGRDGWNCNGTGGTVWFYANDGAGAFTKRVAPITTAGQDLDFGLAFQIDNDTDGRLDIIAADGNNAGTYYKILSQKLDIYNLEGEAVSKVIDSLSNDSNAIVSVRVTGLQTSSVNPPATDVKFYVSNNNGENWEILAPNELPPTSDPHAFRHHGADFRWKAELSAEEQTLHADELVFAPASKITPRVQAISFTYESVERRRYTRSGLAYGQVEIAGNQHEFIYSASYFYPGFEATLRAFDITQLGAGTAVGLERVDNHIDVTPRWDAGNALKTRLAGSRVIYAAYASAGDSDGVVNDRLVFNTGEITAPTTSPTLQESMVVDDASKVAVVEFVRGQFSNGAQRPWKFFDVGHSTPVFVGGPTGDSAYLGDSHDTFAATWANRSPTVLIGANDGMLHAFDAINGSERWALVPYNLLAKLKRQRAVDGVGNEVYERQTFVDGAVVVQDVHDGSRWRTVAFVGQAQGQGRADNNYYFAVDVTDTADPQPLWEFTDAASVNAPCSGDPCTTTCTQVCDPPVCSASCTAVDHVFEEVGGEVAMDAEHFNTNNTVAGVHQWEVRTDAAAGVTYMTPTPNSGKNCSGNVTTCGAHMTYQIFINTAAFFTPHFRINASNGVDDSLDWGVDGELKQQLPTSPDNGTWAWSRGTGVYLGAGEHVFDVWMREDGQKLDRIVLRTSGTSPAGAGPAEKCQEVCEPPVCTNDCQQTCVPAGDPWPECADASGVDKECCADPVQPYCAPLGQCAAHAPGATMGETWSPPAVGRVKVGGSSTFAVFFGSGYDNRPGIGNVGRAIYALNATTGELLGRWDLDDIPFASPGNPSTIDNTVPAGAALVDIDDDGYVDRLYIGDLEGRLWRLDTSASATRGGAGNLITNWPIDNIFDAGRPGGGNRAWAPIITTPAVAVLNGAPYVYFGTGGDDRSPDDRTYRFFAVRDGGGNSTRFDTDLSAADLEWVVAGEIGHKYWSSPVIANGTAVYFASLPGDIESVNPCMSGTGQSHVYGYGMIDYADADGATHRAGESLLSEGGNSYLTARSKVRQAMVLRGSLGKSWSRSALKIDRPKTDVMLQEFTGESAAGQPPVRRISEGGTTASRKVIILRWREIKP